ncbi:MAG: hypothetical protein ABGX37_00085 [Methylococcales bacterium]|jgi:nitrate reductase NapE component
MSETKPLKNDLTLHWIIAAMLLAMLITYNIICHLLGSDIQYDMQAEQRVLIRSIFYVIAIILFPITNLIRYIFIRLNETMPGNTIAKHRYLITVTVSLFAIEIVGLFGFIMFILGDDFNTLYIFSTLALLGIFVHRPKLEEYQNILEALRIQKLKG